MGDNSPFLSFPHSPFYHYMVSNINFYFSTFVAGLFCSDNYNIKKIFINLEYIKKDFVFLQKFKSHLMIWIFKFIY
jgi:hypothetical protein